MAQFIEPLQQKDIDQLGRQLGAAQALIPGSELGTTYDGTLDDLKRLQAILDSDQLQPTDTPQLQCLGVPFGQLLVKQNLGFDWWMVSDEQGRDPCLRYRETDLLIYPLTMISKRVEDGAQVDVSTLYSGLLEQLQQITPQLDAQLDATP